MKINQKNLKKYKIKKKYIKSRNKKKEKKVALTQSPSSW